MTVPIAVLLSHEPHNRCKLFRKLDALVQDHTALVSQHVALVDVFTALVGSQCWPESVQKTTDSDAGTLLACI